MGCTPCNMNLQTSIAERAKLQRLRRFTFNAATSGTNNQPSQHSTAACTLTHREAITLKPACCQDKICYSKQRGGKEGHLSRALHAIEDLPVSAQGPGKDTCFDFFNLPNPSFADDSKEPTRMTSRIWQATAAPHVPPTDQE